MLGDFETARLSRFAKPELRFDETRLRGLDFHRGRVLRSLTDAARVAALSDRLGQRSTQGHKDLRIESVADEGEASVYLE